MKKETKCEGKCRQCSPQQWQWCEVNGNEIEECPAARCSVCGPRQNFSCRTIEGYPGTWWTDREKEVRGLNITPKSAFLRSLPEMWMEDAMAKGYGSGLKN